MLFTASAECTTDFEFLGLESSFSLSNIFKDGQTC